MAVRVCRFDVWRTVEVCGGVCECAGNVFCHGCGLNLVGPDAEASFLAGCAREYPV